MMKNVGFVLVASFLMLTTVHAQTSAKVKVNVELNPFQSIEIGSGAGTDGPISAGYDDEVTLRYVNSDDYKLGVEKTIAKQLKVTSIGSGFRIKATLSENGQFSKLYGNGDSKVNADQLLQIAVGGKTSINAAAQMDLGSFGASIGAEASVLDEELDVRYIGKPITSPTLLKQLLNNKDSQALYSIDVLYSISAN